METRKLHKIEQSTSFCNVDVAFSIQNVGNKVSESDICEAMKRTCDVIPILRMTIDLIDGVQHFNSNMESVENSILFLQEQLSTSVSIDSSHMSDALCEIARRPSGNSKSLFSLTASYYSVGILFYLVVNHAITDGPSIFIIVDTFLQYLSDIVDNTTLASIPSAQRNRDLISELLKDSRTMQETNQDTNKDTANSVSQESRLRFPSLTDSNVDINNGCIRVLSYDLSTEKTECILQNCRQNNVSFQSMLSAVCSLALVKLLHTSHLLNDETWNTPILHMSPANMRRYLSSTVDAVPVERNVCMTAMYMRWTMQPLHSYDALSQRKFWSEFVYTDAHKPINDILNSNYLFQSLCSGERDISAYNALWSVTCTSLGKVPIKPTYGSLHVKNVVMQVGIPSVDQAHFDSPKVPDSMINSDTEGYVLLHAYTVLGKLHLSGSYYGYKTEFIKQYYDEIMRLLNVISSEGSGLESLRIDHLFKL